MIMKNPHVRRVSSWPLLGAVLLGAGWLIATAPCAQADDANTNSTAAAPAMTPGQSTPPRSQSSSGSTVGGGNLSLARSFGIGAMVGEPSGLTLKTWINDTSAIDCGLGWSLREGNPFEGHMDYLYHWFDVIPSSMQGRWPIYGGVGARVLFNEHHRDNWGGIRLPVGVAYLAKNKPLEIFAELAPVLDVSPTGRLSFDGVVGVRYYFK